MAVSTASYAIGLPEILNSTLHHLDPPTLAACARVNSSWYDAASRQLWQGSLEPTSIFRTPTIKQLLLLGALSHDNLVANLRHSRALRITLGTDFVDTGTWAGFCLPCAARRFVDNDPFRDVKPESVRIACDHRVILELLEKERLAERVLWQGLKELNLEAIPLDPGSILSEDFFHRLEVACPRLRKLHIALNIVGSRKHALAGYLASSSIISLTVDQVNDIAGVLSTILPTMLRMPLLEHLNILNTGCDFDSILADARHAQQVQPIFPSLKSLQLSSAYSQSSLALFPHVPQLEKLHISLSPHHSMSEYLGAFAFCTKMSTLIISIDDYTYHQYPVPAATSADISGPLLSFASACPQMQDFRLYGCNGPPDGVKATSMTTLKALTQRWPELRQLDFHLKIPETLTAADLLRITLKCPRLRELRLAASLDFNTLEALPPCARSDALERLHLHNADSKDVGPLGSTETAVAWARKLNVLLEGCLPRLRELRVTPYAQGDEWRHAFDKELRLLLARRTGGGGDVDVEAATWTSRQDVISTHSWMMMTR